MAKPIQYCKVKKIKKKIEMLKKKKKLGCLSNEDTHERISGSWMDQAIKASTSSKTTSVFYVRLIVFEAKHRAHHPLASLIGLWDGFLSLSSLSLSLLSLLVCIDLQEPKCCLWAILKWESKSLFTEPKNELHKHKNSHSSKWIGFILEKRKVQSSHHRYWERVKCLQKGGLTAGFFYFFFFEFKYNLLFFSFFKFYFIF